MREMQYVKSPIETCATCEMQILFEIIYASYYIFIVLLVFFATVALNARQINWNEEAFTLSLLFQALNYAQLQQVTGKRAGFSTFRSRTLVQWKYNWAKSKVWEPRCEGVRLMRFAQWTNERQESLESCL